MRASTNRRQFLKKAALATGGIGLQLAPARNIASAQPTNSLEADFCVVGAGYAGLTTALRLQQAGRSVVLLEARDRVGGRIWSDPLSDRTPIDIGGHWVGPQQTAILRLAQEMQVPTYPSYHTGDILLVDKHGTARRFSDLNFLLNNLGEFLELGSAIADLDRMARTVPLAAPWEATQAGDWDSQTVATWIKANVHSQLASDTLRALLGAVPAEMGELSLLHLLFMIHAGGGIIVLLAGTGGAQDSSIVGGAQAVANRVNALLGPAVHLSAPVRRIAQDGSGVEVTSDTVSVRARRVIVTIPPTLSGQILYDPPLPPDRAQLIQRMPMGSVIKATLVYDEAFWRRDKLSGGSIAISSPVVATLDGGLAAGEDRPGLLIAFIGGNHARKLGRLSPAKRQQIVVDAVAARFGPQAARLSRNVVYPPTGLPYIDHNWAEEEWTRGDYSAYLPPGVLTGFGPAISKPVGRIHWAGAETATEWPGYMDGAVRSGERAATEVLAAN